MSEGLPTINQADKQARSVSIVPFKQHQTVCKQSNITVKIKQYKNQIW